jgi:hypothetical protein
VRTFQRDRFLLLAATGIALVAATIYTMRSADGERAPAGKLGPTEGSAEAYVKTKSTYLQRVATRAPTTKAAALVSLKTYVPASSVQSMIRSLKATAVIVRFPASEQELQFVRTSVTNALEQRTTDLRRELQAEIDALSDELAAAEGERRAEVDRLLAQRKADLAKVKADCACVFAFAVEGASLEELRRLAGRPEVRLVDVPEPLTSDLAGWELGPLVPHDDGRRT